MPAAKRRLLETRADADDMADDYALLRKVKKGKITEVKASWSRKFKRNSLPLDMLCTPGKETVCSCLCSAVHMHAGL